MIQDLHFFITVVILLVIIAYMYFAQANIFDHLVNGFYEADASFCAEAGLETFCIYIDNDIKGGERACYILGKKDGEIIINEPCTIKLALKNGSMCDTSPKYFTCEFKDLSEECMEIFPLKQNLQYYPISGKIILHDDETVTYVGYKNGMNTEMKSVINDKKYIDEDSE
jgi:hypothetical protein